MLLPRHDATAHESAHKKAAHLPDANAVHQHDRLDEPEAPAPVRASLRRKVPAVLRVGEPFNPYGMFDGVFVPNWLYNRREISADARILYARMARLAARGGECKPSQEYLARDMGCSKRTVQRWIDELVEVGLIHVVQRGLQRSNVYVFLWNTWAAEAAEAYAGDVSLDQPEDVTRDALDDVSADASLSVGREFIRRELLRSRASRRERPGIRPVEPEQGPDEVGADMHRKAKPADSPPARAGSGRGLAQHFRTRATATYDRQQLGPSPFNDSALASTFARWKREDHLSEEQIRIMIDVFCTEPPTTGKPLWQAFLAQRTRLSARAQAAVSTSNPTERYRADFYDD